MLVAGRYRILRRLGTGGMGVVELAEDVELGRSVALKLLGESFLDDAQFRERFVREARLAAGLAHANIVRIYDAGVFEARPFIVMEYVDGETLARLDTRERPLSIERVVDLAVQAAAGLAHAHEHGLVHRDITPHNLLVRRDGVLKIADFGIARALDSTQLTAHGTVLGTVAYLAPEQAAGETATPATDVYALGAVLYELLAGRPPFVFTSVAELVAQQRTGAVIPVRDLAPTVPAPLEAVVMRCLARDPRFRFRSGAGLQAALAESRSATAAGRLATTSTRRRPPRSSPAFSRRRLLAAAGAAAAAGVALGAAALGGHGDRTRIETVRSRIPIVRHGGSAADEARALAAWLRARSP